MKALICGCCGERCLGKQHWNHDTGYGLCPRCVPFILDNPRAGPDELKGYGTPGVNFAAPLTTDCTPGMLVGWKNLDNSWHVGTLKAWDNGTAIVKEHRHLFTADPDKEVAVRFA